MSILYYNRYIIDPCGFKKVTKPLGFRHYVNAFSFAKRKYISGVINLHICDMDFIIKKYHHCYDL